MLFRSNDTATTEIYTLSLHDALPISGVLAAAPLLTTSCNTYVPSAVALKIGFADVGLVSVALAGGTVPLGPETIDQT